MLPSKEPSLTITFPLNVEIPVTSKLLVVVSPVTCSELLIVEIPLTFKVPSTCSLEVGFVVPIPTNSDVSSLFGARRIVPSALISRLGIPDTSSTANI